MAASDATPFPIKNQAYRATFPILDADGDLVTGAASLDSEVSKDAGAFADCTNEATEIATSSGVYYLDLTATEMNADTVAVIVKTGTAGAKTTTIVLNPITDGLDIPVNTTHFAGTAITAAAGIPEVKVASIAANAITATAINADALTAAKVAADVGTEIASAVRTELTTEMGRIDAAVTSRAASSALATAQADLDTITGTDGVTLATAQALYAPSKAGDAMALTSGERTTLAAAIWNALTSGMATVGSIGKKLADWVIHSAADVWAAATRTLTAATNITSTGGTTVPQTGDSFARIGANGAGLTDLATQASVNTIDDFLDTEVAAILAAVDTEIASIKAKTDTLPAAPAAVGDIPTANANADALLDRASGVETSITLRQALRGILSSALAKLSGAETTTISVRDANDTKNRIVATVDADGNRSAVTLDLT